MRSVLSFQNRVLSLHCKDSHYAFSHSSFVFRSYEPPTPNMRLIKQNIERKDGSGSATLLPEEPEDMVSMSVYTHTPGWFAAS